MHTTPVLGALVALALLAPLDPAAAASGTVLGVDPAARIDGKSVLTVGADVFIGDKVVTDARGEVQIKFSDRTELVVGPNSALVIEDYLLREDNSAGKFAINALSGTFRFATGAGEKDRYQIRTSTGTIGVRGTMFDFNVLPDSTSVLLFHGSVVLCDFAGECVTLDDVCQLGAIDLTQPFVIGASSSITGAERQALKEAFKYAENQSSLLRDFRFENARECFNQGFVGPSFPETVTKSGTPEPVCPDYNHNYSYSYFVVPDECVPS